MNYFMFRKITLIYFTYIDFFIQIKLYLDICCDCILYNYN